jgi:hypothetical protein
VLEASGKGEQKRHRVGGEMLVVAAVHAGHDHIALDQRIVEIRAAEHSAGRTDPAQLLGPGEQLERHGPVRASAVSMSVRASLGSAYALATEPGTARPIFSGHDGSASGDNSRMVKLIAQLQLVHMAAG